jgi:hypothetical protein
MSMNNITLTETEQDDLNAFFQFQLDEEANYLAAFTAKDPHDKTAYIEKYGFVKIGKDKGFANARQAEIEEFICKLAAGQEENNELIKSWT